VVSVGKNLLAIRCEEKMAGIENMHRLHTPLICAILIIPRYNNANMRKISGFLLLLSLALFIPQNAFAQAGSASDLISTVNSLRQSQGLVPYTVDSSLMAYAQSHSDYMASIGTWTHTRADGSTAFSLGIKENVAMGTNMSVQHCVYTVWSDWTHWNTMVGYPTGSVGAGVAVDGDMIYYTLNVHPGSIEISNAPDQDVNDSESQVELSSLTAQETTIPILPIVTSTPDDEGMILHRVQYGDTLFTISEAYDIPIDEILANSGLSATTTQIFEGDILVIKPGTLQPPTPTSTRTERPDTPTPTVTKVTQTHTPFPTRTPGPTRTPTQPLTVLHHTFADGKLVGISLVVASTLGLILLIYLGFIKKEKLND
jgi:LysM repeat protein